MRENKTFPDKELSEMSTEQLDKKLQQELQKEDPDEEVVLGIMRILQDREADYPVEITEEVSVAWERYQEKTAPSKKHIQKRAWFVSVAAVAAVICVVIMTIPRTVGADSVMDVLFRWTESVFEFFTPEQDATNPPVDIVFNTDNPGLQKLYDKVTELGVTESVVPMWLPEDFFLSDLKISPAPGGNKVFVRFENGSDAVLITYRLSMDISAKVEKEETGVAVFETGEVSHFITDNDENLAATWTVDGVECLLNTDLPKEDFYKIIKSIYRSELSQ